MHGKVDFSVNIRVNHPLIQHAGVQFDLAHLDAIPLILNGQGRNNADIHVRISFQSHVYSEGCNYNTLGRFADEGGAWRKFCPIRYGLSLGLGGFWQAAVAQKWLTWESKDRNQISNYMIADLGNGGTYAIIYRLAPSLSNHFDVEIIVKSAYPRAARPAQRKFNVNQLVKKCYYNEIALP